MAFLQAEEVKVKPTLTCISSAQNDQLPTESQSALQGGNRSQSLFTNSQCSTNATDSEHNQDDAVVNDPIEMKPVATKRALRVRTNNKAKRRSVGVNTSVTYKVPTPKSKRTRKNRNRRLEEEQSRKVTDYFPIRRSARQIEADTKIDRLDIYKQRIADDDEPNLKVINDDVKGRGIVADKVFERREFVCEYRGDLLTKAEALARENKYSQNEKIGSYMYFFNYQGKSYCVDATDETKYYGRLANHSRLKPNCKMTVVEGFDGKPHVCLIASKLIHRGVEILYDYGDRTKQALQSHPWLKH